MSDYVVIALIVCVTCIILAAMTIYADSKNHDK